MYLTHPYLRSHQVASHATQPYSSDEASKPLLLAQGMTESEFAQLIETMRRECEQLRYTWPFYIAYGQRPW